MSFANDGLIKVPTSGSATGDTYGEKGIEQGNDFGTPGHSVPSPVSSIASYNPMVSGSSSGPAPSGNTLGVDKSMNNWVAKK